MSLRDLYQEIIIDHGKHPRHFGVLPNATLQQAGHNPLCGDKLVVYLIERDGLVEDIQFDGTGCAISVASASLMSESVKGKKISDILNVFDHFHQLLTEGKEPTIDLGKLAALSGVAQFPIRVKCATLAWHTLRAALLRSDTTVSTE